MNIFFLHLLTKQCAQQHIDVHVRKMIIEYAQLLCTAHRYLDGVQVIEIGKSGRKIKRWVIEDNNSILYKSTHVNHPSAVWVRQSIINYSWLYQLFVDLCDEYIYRFNKVHLTDTKLRQILKNAPINIPIKNFTPFPLAMDIKYKRDSCVESYRTLYIYEKQTNKNGKPMNVWSKRSPPQWLDCNLL